ncbi:MAG TPA: response regulator transcription factor, partial [Ktedonobacteraceae bacterium]|nr:response regulator transcription factor [Ktedonobacteraceae bacterium]
LRVILIEAHTLVRLALQHVVSSFPCTVVTASINNIQDVFTVTDLMTVHVIILGPSISVVDSLQTLQLLRERQNPCGLIVIHQHLYPETAHTLMKHGIHGLLDENASEQDLAEAIMAVSEGNIFLTLHTCGLLAASISNVVGHLTDREMQVLGRLKHGESNFRIAHMLGLKEKTIEKYLTRIYDKLNVHSRTEAILSLQDLRL